MAEGSDAFTWRVWWIATVAQLGAHRLILPALLLSLAVPLTIALLTPWLATVLLVAVAISLDEVLLPVVYRLDDEAVEARTMLRTRRHRWAEFTEAIATPYGVLLRSALRRSLHLACRERTDAVLAFATDQIARSRASSLAVRDRRGLESSGGSAP